MNRNVNQAVLGSGSILSRRPYPQWENIDFQEAVGNSVYHGRTLKVEKRFSQGLSWLTSYTFGKMIDDAGNPQNSYNRHAERSLSDFHNKHRMTLSSTYELPFGNGRTKNTRMGESKNVQFRAEFFNALNHANFDPPSVQQNSANFGRIFAVSDSRQIQFGMKLFY